MYMEWKWKVKVSLLVNQHLSRYTLIEQPFTLIEMLVLYVTEITSCYSILSVIKIA